MPLEDDYASADDVDDLDLADQYATDAPDVPPAELLRDQQRRDLDDGATVTPLFTRGSVSLASRMLEAARTANPRRRMVVPAQPRTSALGEKLGALEAAVKRVESAAATTEKSEPWWDSVPWWGWVLGTVGAGLAGYGVYRLLGGGEGRVRSVVFVDKSVNR